MKVMGLLILYEFYERHSGCVAQIHAWIAEAKEAEWATPNGIKTRYPKASFLPDNRVIFNIKGNSYRLATKVYYERQIIIVERIGTHAEYNRWRF